MHRFILTRYLWREHLGPFCFSFALITLIFILDLVFRHLSRILSKGLPLLTVLEFFALNLAWIIATAVPMAVLTASLMAFGRLAADQEITALQASGVSLWRLVLPIFAAASLLAAGLIWFNNNILPDFNHRARLLAADITRKKPSVKIEPGIWFQEIPNYQLLVKTLEDSLSFSQIRDLILDDNTDPNIRRTISAQSGVLEPRPNEGMLRLTLFNGEIQEVNIEKLEEFRRVRFAKHALSIPAAEGMFWQRHQADDRTDREKSVAQMRQEVQTQRARSAWLAQRLNLLVGIDFYPYFGRTFNLVPDTLVHLLLTPRPPLRLLPQQQRLLGQINSLLTERQDCEQTAQTLTVEIQKKYAIPVACMVFVLIGAPMGVLARRGGLATGVSLSLGFFLLYWAFLIGGEDLADRRIVSPFVAMWAANFLTGGCGLYIFVRIAQGRTAPQVWRWPLWRHRLAFESLKQRLRWKKEEKVEIFWPRPQLPVGAAATEVPAPIIETTKPVDAEVPGPEREVVSSPEPLLAPLPAIPSALPEFEFTPIPEILRRFADRVRADLVLLANGKGVPAACCQRPTSPAQTRAELELIAKLAASQMAALQNLGPTLDEAGAFTCIFQESARYHLFIYQIHEDFILTALIEKSVVLGLVRIHANEAVVQLRKILSASFSV